MNIQSCVLCVLCYLKPQNYILKYKYNIQILMIMLDRKFKQKSPLQSFPSVNSKQLPKAVTKLIKKQDLRKIANNKFKRIFASRNKRISRSQATEKHCPMTNDRLAQIIDQNLCECPICFDLPVQPSMLNCGHVYCLQCLEQNSVYSQKCCLCRHQQQQMQVTPNIFVSNLLNNVILPNYSEQINYWYRQSNFQCWQRKRRIDINRLSIGDFVDIKDDNHTWRVGIIKMFFYNKRNQFCAVIKYRINSQFKIISLAVKSRRLANIGFFTRSIYLKERNEDITKNFIESIEIPEIYCNFIESEIVQNIGMESSSLEGEGPTQLTTQLPLQLFEHEMGRSSQQYLFF